jgi:hypothetical protein
MEGMVKGYLTVATGRFITGDAALCARVPPELLVTIAEHEKSIKAQQWYTRHDVIVLWRAIAAGSDEATAYSDLVRCGESIANYATSTFLKLLLKVLTPGMFARKFPDLWSHDHKGGRVEPDRIDDTGMRITIRDIEGFEHVSAVSAGFTTFALKSIGLKNVVTRSPNWSLTTPGPRDAVIEVSWDKRV